MWVPVDYVILLISIFIFLSQNLDSSVVKSILNINESLAKITGGNLAEKVNESSFLEFDELSMEINRTVERLNRMIEDQIRIFSKLKVVLCPFFGRGVTPEILQASIDDAKQNYLSKAALRFVEHWIKHWMICFEMSNSTRCDNMEHLLT